MGTTTLLILQSVLTAAQVFNAGIASVTRNPTITLAVGALVAGLQVAVQHLGNQTIPRKD